MSEQEQGGAEVLPGVLQAMRPPELGTRQGLDGFHIHGNPASIFGALAKAQAAFAKVERTKLVKVRSEKGNYDFWYAPLENVLGAVEAALNANELALMQPLVKEGQVWVLRTILGHASGAYLECTLSLPSTDGWQKLGSTVTYARRYMVGSLLGIAPEEDDDGTGAEDMPRETQTRQAGPRANTQPKPPAQPPKAASVAPGPSKPASVPPAAPKAEDQTALQRRMSQGQDSGGAPLTAGGKEDGTPEPAASRTSEPAAPPRAPEAIVGGSPVPAAEAPLSPNLAPPSDEQNAQAGRLFRSKAWPMSMGAPTDVPKFNREATALFCQKTVGLYPDAITNQAQMARMLEALEKLPWNERAQSILNGNGNDVPGLMATMAEEIAAAKARAVKQPALPGVNGNA
jgi:hypothetical protein